MTPYTKENDIIQFGETKWVDKKEQLGSFAQMNMFRGIFSDIWGDHKKRKKLVKLHKKKFIPHTASMEDNILAKRTVNF